MRWTNSAKGAGFDFLFLRREGPAPQKHLQIPSEPGGPRLREPLDPIAEPPAVYLKNEYPTKITLKSTPGLIVPRYPFEMC